LSQNETNPIIIIKVISNSFNLKTKWINDRSHYGFKIILTSCMTMLCPNLNLTSTLIRKVRLKNIFIFEIYNVISRLRSNFNDLTFLT
jgi:hypothetical protein